jgi:hypothetical protein
VGSTEGDFNARLTRGFKPLSPDLLALKTSDRFHAGVPDFILVYKAQTAALEVKYVSSWPTNQAKLLGHPFQGPQITYLRRLHLAGARAFGLVGIKPAHAMYLIAHDELPEDGNWSVAEFTRRFGDRALPTSNAVELVRRIFF